MLTQMSLVYDKTEARLTKRRYCTIGYMNLCMVEIGIVSVCGNTMCYLNYREAEVQVLKRT